jgi:hypothetical protein
MKKAIAISLALLVFAASVKDFVIWAGFKINQDFIAKTLCINRDNLEKQCNGKCYLNKKITESKEKDPAKMPVPQPDERKQVVFFCETIQTILPDSDQPQRVKIFHQAGFHEQSCPTDIFQPPRTSPASFAA